MVLLSRALFAVLLVALPHKAAAEMSPLHNRTFDCLMEPKAVVKLGAQVTGLIKEVRVDRGERVKQGQIVVTLHSEVQEAVVAFAHLRATNEFQVRAQQNRLDFLRRRVERMEALQRKEFASVAAVDEATSEFRMTENAEQEAQLSRSLAKLELERETQILAQRQIRSPIDGIVVERTLSAGEYRHDNNHFMTVAQIDPLNVETYLPISEWGRINVGSTAVVTPEHPINGQYEAKVTVIDRIADPASGTFGVRLAVANPENMIPAGIRCKVSFND
jgi:RND family efflux transporter MFP subunit